MLYIGYTYYDCINTSYIPLILISLDYQYNVMHGIVKIMLPSSMIVNFNTLYEIWISLSLQLSLALSPYIQ